MGWPALLGNRLLFSRFRSSLHKNLQMISSHKMKGGLSARIWRDGIICPYSWGVPLIFQKNFIIEIEKEKHCVFSFYPLAASAKWSLYQI